MNQESLAVIFWIATALLSVLTAVVGWGFRRSGRAEQAQWRRLGDHDTRIDLNTTTIKSMGVRVAGDDRRVSESLDRLEKRQEAMGVKLDTILEKLPR